MKKMILFYTAMFLTMITSAQDFAKPVRDKISRCEYLIGNWSGTGWVILPDGSKSTTDVTEKIGYKAGNTVIQMEGLGTQTLDDGKQVTVHDALGVLSYDVFEKKYKMHSFIDKGMQTQAEVELKEDGAIVWWFGAGPTMTIRYTLRVGDGKWNEIGERSTDGENWTKFFEMNLSKN